MTTTTQKGEWHSWQPNRKDGSKEPQEWGDFMAWCDQWGKYTADVPYLTAEEVERENAKTLPKWYLRVYGGQK